MTQNAMILGLLERHPGGLTPAMAVKFGCYRLAARVAELRAAGHAIVTVRERHESGYHALYQLVRENEQRALWGDR